MPNIIFLVGLPASGKSTWIKNNQKLAKDYQIISSDNIIDDYAKSQNKTYDEVFSEYVKEADRQFNERFMMALYNNENIIVDRTNLSPKTRKKLLSNVPENYFKLALVFQISPTERKKRMDLRSQTDGKSIPVSVIQQMEKSFVFPSFSEGFDAVKQI